MLAINEFFDCLKYSTLNKKSPMLTVSFSFGYVAKGTRNETAYRVEVFVAKILLKVIVKVFDRC